MRRGGLIQLVLIALVAGAIATAVAVFIPWLPTPASREAGRINFVYWFATIISLFVFAIVMAILIYSMINFRVKKGDLSDGPPVHGHTQIEIIWTIIPTVLVIAIAIVSAIVLAKDSHAGTNPLIVRVTGVQFAWQFQYPNGYKTTSLYLPDVGHIQPGDKTAYTGVKLEITSNDVLHSFWVPQFAQKQDAVPGQINDLVISPDRVGTFPVICTELCGLGHALMRSQAIVETPADFATWYAKTNPPATPPGGGDVKTLATQAFTAGGCIACHMFKPIPSATGTVGPSLDDLSADAKKAGQPLSDFIKSSITDPDAYIAPGYQPGVMPPGLDKTLSSAQLSALVQYLADNTN